MWFFDEFLIMLEFLVLCFFVGEGFFDVLCWVIVVGFGEFMVEFCWVVFVVGMGLLFVDVFGEM